MESYGARNVMKMQRNSQAKRQETLIGTNDIVVFQSFGAQLTPTIYLDVRKTPVKLPITLNFRSIAIATQYSFGGSSRQVFSPSGRHKCDHHVVTA
jgi:hypothetical protein